jgi:glycosyltransferase involved in cell wall biosynthesis
MKVLAIVPNVYDTSPGQRYRIEQWAPMLRDEGVEITYAPFESPELNEVLYKSGMTVKKMLLVLPRLNDRFASLRTVKQYDLVYIFREAALLGPAVFERMIARSGVPIVFDFDDAVFVTYRSPSNGYLSYLKFAGKTKTICRLSAHVMAGNPYLASYAQQVNANVTVIPSTIDTDKYQPHKPVPNEVPVIGWTGSHSTVQHLNTLSGALRKLARRFEFRLRVIGAPTYQLAGIDVEAIKWRSQTEVADLYGIDIGVMPLPEDAWSKGKCGMKALQFMALEIPTICSPVGVNTEIIQDNQNGFLAATEDEWVEKLSSLIRSVSLRERLGKAGRRSVEQKYSAKTQAPRVLEIFRSVVHSADAGTERLVSTRSVMSEN